MNHFKTHFSFTQLRGSHPHLSSLSHFLLGGTFLFLSLTLVSSSFASSLSLFHVYLPQLWRTAGSSWSISPRTNCVYLCPMCHSRTRDATCASSTQILLRKPTQTSLWWVGVTVRVRPSHPSVRINFPLCSAPSVDGKYETALIFGAVSFGNWNKMSAN